MMWFWIILALAYLLSPYDLIPGLHGIGWIDDVIVLGMLYRYLRRIKKQRTGPVPPFGSQQGEFSHDHPNETSAASSKTPYDILNVPPTASQEEIRAAYRQLAGQYHPDKVSHLGEEFQKLADQRFKEIQAAYDTLKKDE